MDFVIEFIGELFLEFLGMVIESDRVPKWLRYLLLGLIIAPLLALVVYGIYSATEWFVIAILSVLGLGFIGIFVYFVYNIQRSGVLRKATKEELPQILKLYRSVIGKPGCTWNVFYPNEDTLHEDFSTGNLYVLQKGKKMIGAGSVVPENELDALTLWHYKENAGEIARIVIDPKYQGKKFGKHLVKKLCLILERQGCQAVHLLAAVENNHAKNLYRNAGFSCKDKCHMYDHDYYAYEKKL